MKHPFIAKFGALAMAALLGGVAAANQDILIGAQAKEATVKAAAMSVGTIVRKEPTGFFRVSLKEGLDLAKARAILNGKGITYVFDGTANDVDPAKIKSIEEYVAYKRAFAKIAGVDPEEAGLDFYEALEFYLGPRVDATGRLDQDAYLAAVRHRDQMPGALQSWFGSDSRATSGVFQYVGPKDLNAPYRTYYGVRSLSGRKNDVAFAPSAQGGTIYTASAGGGIWKTTDSGTNWYPKSDKWPFLHTSSVAVHPANSNIVLAGCGDYVGFFSAQTQGVQRSTDGGTTWTLTGAADFGDKVVSEISYCPEDNNVVVCTTGRGGASAGDVWRSTNGGVTWARTNATNGDWDDLDVAGAAFVGGSRYMWAVGGNKIAKSTDRGATWVAVTAPAGWSNSIADVAASQNDPDGAYIIGSMGKVYKTTNGGTTWTDITAGVPSGYNWSQSTYDIYVACGDNGAGDVIYVGLITVAASDDGGATWADIALSYQATSKWHNDQHCMAFHPLNANQGVLGGDGGLAGFTYNPAANTATMNNAFNRTIYDTQFYFMSVHPQNHNYVQGGTQDNASPASYNNMAQWANLYAGDGGGSGYDGTTPAKHYTTSQGGGVFRYDTDLDLSPVDISHNTGVFVTPLAMGAAGRTTVFSSGSSKVKRNLNGTAGWTNSATTMNSSAQQLTVSNRNLTRLFTSHGNGDIWLSTDGGATLAKRDNTLPNVGVRDVEESPWTDFYCLAALQSTSSASTGVWRTSNIAVAAPAWAQINGAGATALPAMPCNAVARDPWDSSTYYAGTDVGLFVSKDAGSNWYNMNVLGLPNVHVNDLWVSADKAYLYVATFGRGIWRIALKAAKLSNMALSKYAIYGGDSVYMYVYLDGTTAPPGVNVTTYDNSDKVATPASILVQGGYSYGYAPVTTSVVAATTAATLTATYGGISVSRTLTLYAAPAVLSVTFNPNPIQGGNRSTGTVILASIVAIDTKIYLSESSPYASLPATVFTIPAGQRSGVFDVSTTAPPQTTSAFIQAYAWPNGAGRRTGTLTITP